MIYICIPTYNEERTIGVMLWKIRQVMADFPRDYQILVVDDASTDATAQILAPYTRILPLTILRNEERRGYAASLETALREAVRRSSYPKRDIIVTLQADFTEEPDEIPTLVKRIEGGADVVASEVREGLAKAPRLVRWARRLLGYLLRRAAWPDQVSDPLSGFRAYRLITIRKALQSRDGRPLLEWEGWAANAALLRAAMAHARRVEETPVTLRYDRRRRTTRFRPLETGRHVVRFLRTGAASNGSNGNAPAPAPRQKRRAGPPTDAPEDGAVTAVGGDDGGERENTERRRRPRQQQDRGRPSGTGHSGTRRRSGGSRRGGRRGGGRAARSEAAKDGGRSGPEPKHHEKAQE